MARGVRGEPTSEAERARFPLPLFPFFLCKEKRESEADDSSEPTRRVGERTANPPPLPRPRSIAILEVRGEALLEELAGAGDSALHRLGADPQNPANLLMGKLFQGGQHQGSAETLG